MYIQVLESSATDRPKEQRHVHFFEDLFHYFCQPASEDMSYYFLADAKGDPVSVFHSLLLQPYKPITFYV